MTFTLIIFAIWLIPGILSYLLAGWHSGDWKVDGRDWLLVIPAVNWVVLGFICCMLFDDWFDSIRI